MTGAPRRRGGSSGRGRGVAATGRACFYCRRRAATVRSRRGWAGPAARERWCLGFVHVPRRCREAASSNGGRGARAPKPLPEHLWSKRTAAAPPRRHIASTRPRGPAARIPRGAALLLAVLRCRCGRGLLLRLGGLERGQCGQDVLEKLHGRESGVRTCASDGDCKRWRRGGSRRAARAGGEAAVGRVAANASGGGSLALARRTVYGVNVAPRDDLALSAPRRRGVWTRWRLSGSLALAARTVYAARVARRTPLVLSAPRRRRGPLALPRRHRSRGRAAGAGRDGAQSAALGFFGRCAAVSSAVSCASNGQGV